jgi:hypothetical protein
MVECNKNNCWTDSHPIAGNLPQKTLETFRPVAAANYGDVLLAHDHPIVFLSSEDPVPHFAWYYI